MARNWETTLRTFSKPSSATEQVKSDNAERMIRDAVKNSPKLSEKDIEVFAQGSYRNNTNVRQDSDVDICILCHNSCFSDFSMAKGFTRDDVALFIAHYQFDQFKNEVEEALNSKFGRRGVIRGNKAFDITANSYRVEADAVPAFEHRLYTNINSNGSYSYLSGVEIVTDKGLHIKNWPKQNYENGVAKNTATGHRYKFLTRALKRLRNEMADNGINAANSIPSYLIECLVWNVPNDGFGHDTYLEDMRWVLAHTYNSTKDRTVCSKWVEVNERKYLFHQNQPWTLDAANSFLIAAWNYIGFE